MDNIILLGYGGHAKSVADCIERQGKYKIVGYTDTKPSQSRYSYLGTDEVLADYRTKGIRYAFVGIGYMGKGDLRQRIYKKLKDLGYELPIIIDPSAIVSSSAKIGEGTFIGKAAVVNAEAKVGNMCIVNTKSLIEHECILADFCHVSVGAVLCGQVELGKSSFIGANSTIIQGIKVPEKSFVPAGEVVKRK